MSMRDSFRRFDPCPCGSNLRAKKCCYVNPGVWLKKPATIIPPGPETGVQNEKCYASTTKDCSSKISREHYISNNLLKFFELNGKVEIGGLAWMERETMLKVSRQTLASKILCERHNNALSPLDTTAGSFLKTIGAFDKNFNVKQPTNEFKVFCGEDIERWMLKTTLGMIAARQIRTKTNVALPEINSVFIDILYGRSEFPEKAGMYFTPTETTHHIPSFSFLPKTHPQTGAVLAAELTFNNFIFNLLLATPDYPEHWGIHRPRTLIFRDEGKRVDKTIEISWASQEYQQFALLKRRGTYDGYPPNYPDWARHT